MSVISRLFGKREVVEPIVPDDSHLTQTLNAVATENKEAVSEFVAAAQRQKSDAILARRVIKEVLDRADRIRTAHHANTQK